MVTCTRTREGEKYPVNLIQVITFQNRSTDDSRPISSAHLDLDITEKDVEFCLNGRGISLLVYRECSAERGARYSARRHVPAVKGRVAGREVGREAPLREASVCRTGLYSSSFIRKYSPVLVLEGAHTLCRVTISICLRKARLNRCYRRNGSPFQIQPHSFVNRKSSLKIKPIVRL